MELQKQKNLERYVSSFFLFLAIVFGTRAIRDGMLGKVNAMGESFKYLQTLRNFLKGIFTTIGETALVDTGKSLHSYTSKTVLRFIRTFLKIKKCHISVED